MKKKYIIQIKRRYYWEDVLSLSSQKEALAYKLILTNMAINCRIVEMISL